MSSTSRNGLTNGGMEPLSDTAGTRHTPAEDQARIVSLVPSITELLFAIDLGAQVVGRTTFCIHPADELAGVPQVGGTKDVRLDRLRALAPTHVIVNIDENHREDVEAIRTFVPHVIVTHPLAPADNLSLYRLLGAIFHRQAQAERLCTAFETELRKTLALARDLPHRRVLYLIWRKPWMTVSRETYISRTLALVRWLTLPEQSESRYPEVDLKAAAIQEANLVLFSSEPFPFKAQHMDEFRSIADFSDKRLALMDGTMACWYGSRAILGLRYLRELALELSRETW
jgi:ABC-type Fe3+-hydroxamate transport system substrate-binding protein